MQAAKEKSAVDPVCGMTVNPATAAGSFKYKGDTYYFCSRHCLEKFRKAPAEVLNHPPVGMGTQLVGIERPHSSSATSQAKTKDKAVLASRETIPVPCIPRSCSQLRARALNAAWRSRPRRLPRQLRELNTPVRCIPKSFATRRARVPSAEWRWSRG